MHGYVPGLQKNDTEIIKLNSNENPYPPSDAVLKALGSLASGAMPLQKYPPPRSSGLRSALESRYSLPPGSVLCGNGSDEVLALLFRSLMDPGDSFVMPDPTYSLYPILADAVGVQGIAVPVDEALHIRFDALLTEANARGSKMIIMAMPNAPTGLYESTEQIETLIRSFAGWVVLDEAYAPFAENSFMHRAGTDFPNLICISTFSKAWSLAGMRIGWMAAHPELVQQIDKLRDSYNLSRAAQMAAEAAIADIAWQEENARRIKESREWLQKELSRLGFECLQSSANFVFARVPSGDPNQARSIFEFLEEKKILIRYFSAPRTAPYLRISIGTPEQMEAVVRGIDEFLKAAKSRP